MSKFILSGFADEIDKDLDIQISEFNKHGIKFIEPRKVNEKNIVDHTIKEAHEVKGKLDKNDIKVSSIGSPLGKINITDDFLPHLELFKHTLNLAKILDTKYIRMFSFYIPEGKNPYDYRNEVLDRWKEFIKAAKGSGIILLHENEKRIYGDNAKRCLDMFETLDCEYFKGIFDPANFVQCDVETYPYAFDMLKEHIVYIHIKDALLKDGSNVPAGYGDGKIPEILDELWNRGYEGFLSLEPHLSRFEGLAELEKGLDYEGVDEGRAYKFAMAVKALKDIIKKY